MIHPASDASGGAGFGQGACRAAQSTAVTPSSNCTVPESPADPALAAAVNVARAAAAQEAGTDPVGAHVGVDAEPGGAATHLFEAELAGYRGWRWAATVASAGPGTPVTVSEVVLLPGPDALVAPDWVPWQQRVQAGDLGVGDIMPTPADDPRLVPAYLESDDPAVEEVEHELGLGRMRVMSRFGRLESADRWESGDFGPRSDMARSAPDRCGRCGFYLALGGSLRASFGVCGNELAPADGRVVHVEYGCGAHSEVELEITSPVPVVDLVYDDTTMDIEPALHAHEPAGEPTGQPTEELAEAVATVVDIAPEITPDMTIPLDDSEPIEQPVAVAVELMPVEEVVEPVDLAPVDVDEAVDQTPVEAAVESVESVDMVVPLEESAPIEEPAAVAVDLPPVVDQTTQTTEPPPLTEPAEPAGE